MVALYEDLSAIETSDVGVMHLTVPPYTNVPKMDEDVLRLHSGYQVLEDEVFEVFWTIAIVLPLQVSVVEVGV